jgi:hypothetical protein
MANKQIGDLTLRSGFSADCSLPVDDGIQTWRATGQQILNFVKNVYLEVDDSYTVTDTDKATVIGVETGGTNRTITLPTASANTDRFITIKKIDTGTGLVTIDGESTELIDSAETYILRRQFDAITLHCNGSLWLIVSTFIPQRIKTVAVAQEQKVHTADLLATFSNLVSAERYRLSWQFEVDEKASSANTVSLDARQSGTVVTYLSKFLMASAASNYVVNGTWEFTGISGALTVNLTTTATAQKNPSNRGTEFSHIRLTKVDPPISTTLFD